MGAHGPLAVTAHPHAPAAAAAAARRPLRAAFLVEDALGHVTHARALRAAAAVHADIEAGFLPVPYTAADAVQRVPGLPFSLRLGWRARAALAALPAPPEALFFHTQALAPACWDHVVRTPSVISLDATPAGFATLAAAYDSRVARGAAARLKDTMYRALFARAAGFVAMSAWVRDGLVRDYGVLAARISVVPPGIDTTAFAPGPVRAGGGPLRLLFVGGDFLRKGGATLLAAWHAGLAGRCELDIVTRDAVPGAEGQPGLRVHRGLGPGDAALRGLFAAADVFVLPSRGDASPFAAIEALACGLPVVATAVGALPEIVEHGRNGLVVPVDDVPALVAAITALAADAPRRAAMGRAARADALARFDGAANARRVLDAVLACCRGQP